MRTADKTNGGGKPFPVEEKNRKSSPTNTHSDYFEQNKFTVSQSCAKLTLSISRLLGLGLVDMHLQCYVIKLQYKVIEDIKGVVHFRFKIS